MGILIKMVTKPIGCIFSLIFSVLFFVAILVAGSVIVVDHYAGDMAAYVIKLKTGFEMTFAKQDVSILQGSVDFEGLQITNSAQFPTPGFVNFNQVALKVEPRSLLSDRVVVDSVVVDLKTLTVVKTADKTYNALVFANALKAAAGMNESSNTTNPAQTPAPTSTSKTPQFLIKSLTIRIGTIEYCDYASGSGKPKTYTVNYDKTFTNVTDIKPVAADIAQHFMQVGMSFMADIVVGTLTDLSTYTDLAKNVLNGAGAVGGQVIQGTEGAAKGTGELLKKLNPF